MSGFDAWYINSAYILLYRYLMNVVEAFVASKDPFAVVYAPPTSQLGSHVFVLDSSFNPPHKGHLSLALSSHASLILLLGVRNADKKDGQPAELLQRVEMMIIFADYIFEHYGINVCVSLSSQAKFVDKYVSISEYGREVLGMPLELTFLMGFDTLIRFFDQKYYRDSLQVALSDFMRDCKLIVLVRDDGVHSRDEQKEYFTRIADPGTIIACEWKDHIAYVEESSVADISSSGIRKAVKDNNRKWEDLVLPEISRYIKSNNIYR